MALMALLFPMPPRYDANALVRLYKKPGEMSVYEKMRCPCFHAATLLLPLASRKGVFRTGWTFDLA
jgi:hypothetical protein